MEKLKAGASLVQVYSVLAFEGPGVVSRMRHDLALLMRQEGFRNVSEVVGYDHEEIHWKRLQLRGSHVSVGQESEISLLENVDLVVDNGDIGYIGDSNYDDEPLLVEE